jgi:hypothetical protein
MLKKLLLLHLLMVVLFSAGCVTVLRHEPQKAADEAEGFARTALIRQNLQAAYDASADEFQDYYSLEEFTDFIVKMHPDGYPDKVTATEYEPIPGQPAMNIYLVGTSENVSFYYRFVMQGSADDDYKVIGIYRGSGPYPESSIRQPLENTQ